jgi:hypothetical protein
MTKKNIITKLKKYKKQPAKKRQAYFSLFEEKMIYRTTKTERPSTTKTMVKKALSKV